jgi:hypothetical protein
MSGAISGADAYDFPDVAPVIRAAILLSLPMQTILTIGRPIH